MDQGCLARRVSSSLQDLRRLLRVESSLHQLPVRYRVQYKLCTMMHAIHHGQSAAYLSELVSTVAAQSLRSGLRSASATNYTMPRLLTKFGEPSFSYAGPAAWNSLPHELIESCSNYK